MSELLDRVRREIRERLESTRAAVFEYERLEAALHALGDAGSRATRAVRGDGRGSRATEAAPRARATKKPSGTAKRARAGGAAPRSARAKQSTRSRAGGAAPRSTPAKRGTPSRAGAATPARKRAPRGANRDAVLRVVDERPGVTARELATASGVTGGTLYTLLRRLTDEGTLEKRELPGGQAGYARATSVGSAAQPAAAQPQDAAAADVESRAPERPEEDRDSTPTTDAARSAPNDTQPS